MAWGWGLGAGCAALASRRRRRGPGWGWGWQARTFGARVEGVRGGWWFRGGNTAGATKTWRRGTARTGGPGAADTWGVGES